MEKPTSPSTIEIHPVLNEIIHFAKNNHQIDDESITALDEKFWACFKLEEETSDLGIRTQNTLTLSDAYASYKAKVIGVNNEYHEKPSFIDYLLKKYKVEDTLIVQEIKNKRKKMSQLFSSQ